MVVDILQNNFGKGPRLFNAKITVVVLEVESPSFLPFVGRLLVKYVNNYYLSNM